MKRLFPSRRALAFLASWLVAASFLAWAMWSFGHRQLGGFDHSALVDTAWRMANHQRPYVDFYLTTPIAFYLGAGLAFAGWGPSWSALVGIAIAFALLTFALLTISISSVAAPKFSIGLPLVCELLAMGVTSYWWYNSITAISACVFVAASIALVRRPSSRVSVAMFTLATFLLLMMKPNTAGVLVVVVIAILTAFNGTRRQAILALVVGSAMVVTLLLALGVNPLDVASTYLGVAKTRGLPNAAFFSKGKPGEHYLTIPLIVLSIIPLTAAARAVVRLFRERSTQDSPVALISITGMLTGLMAMFTDSDSNLVVGIPLILVSAACLQLWMLRDGLSDDHLSPWVTASAVAAAAASLVGVTRVGIGPALDGQQVAWGISLFFAGTMLAIATTGVRASSVLLMGVLLWVAGVALLFGAERIRVKYIGPGTFYSDEPLVRIPGPPFFKGVLGSPRLRDVIGEMEAAVERYAPPQGQQSSSVYFGPRLEFAYAAFGIPSPKHLPVWYHPGNSYPEALGDTIAAAFVSQEFEMGVFLKSDQAPDFTYLPARITQDFEQHFQRIDYPRIVVFVREAR